MSCNVLLETAPQIHPDPDPRPPMLVYWFEFLRIIPALLTRRLAFVATSRHTPPLVKHVQSPGISVLFDGMVRSSWSWTLTKPWVDEEGKVCFVIYPFGLLNSSILVEILGLQFVLLAVHSSRR